TAQLVVEVVLDGQPAVAGQRDDARRTFARVDRLLDLVGLPRRALFDGAGRLQGAQELTRRTVESRDFLAVDLDDRVVEVQGVERGQQVLAGVDLGAAVLDAGA